MRSRCSSPIAAARADVRSQLAAAPDLARSLARLVLGRGGPRDLAAIRDGLAAAAALARAARRARRAPDEIAAAAQRTCRAGSARSPPHSRAALADELPYLKRDGGFVRAGYDTALDETRALRDESRRVVAALQARYADETGMRALKVRHNNVLGYFVEVTAQHGEKLLAPPLNATFIHRQTLAGQVRFTTTELAALEAKIASAADRALAMELEIFDRLAGQVTERRRADQARRARRSPCSTSRPALATLAVERDYVRPEVDARSISSIEGGRHPVVEQALRRTAGRSSRTTAISRRRRARAPAASVW